MKGWECTRKTFDFDSPRRIRGIRRAISRPARGLYPGNALKSAFVQRFLSYILSGTAHQARPLSSLRRRRIDYTDIRSTETA